MKTQKETEIIRDNLDTAEILLNLFSKYKNFDSTKFEHYDPDTLFANRKKESKSIENTSVAITQYKESLFKKIINKLKKLFIK